MRRHVHIENGLGRVKRITTICLLNLGLPTFVSAEAVPVQLTNTMVGQYRTDNRNGQDDDDDYGSIINRLNLSGTAENITSAIRVDAMGFFGQEQSWHQNDLRLEQLKVQYSVEIGKFTQVITTVNSGEVLS